MLLYKRVAFGEENDSILIDTAIGKLSFIRFFDL